jgi:hypothetical protein
MVDDQLEPREKLELAMLRAEHQKKFQMMIDFIKEQVGGGLEYANSLARFVVSEAGAYYELIDLPEEFAGACGPGVEHSFITQIEAIRLIEDAARTAEAAASTAERQLQILALYTRRGLVDRKNCYVVDYARGSTYRPGQNVTGEVKHGIMPLFFKIKLDAGADELAAPIGMNHCILVCIVTSGDRFPLIRIRLDSEHTTDLISISRARTVQ